MKTAKLGAMFLVAVLALAGIIMHLIAGTKPALIWNDIVLCLFAIGMLYRINYMSRKREKENLQEKVKEVDA